MKRAGQLFDAIFSRDNLRHAAHRALKGKRSQPDARYFCEHLDQNLECLAEEALQGQLQLGVSHQFLIHDPKLRLITAPCFRERVLHHAIMAQCEPVFERWLVADTFACRVGLGRDKALARAQQFARQFPYFCQMDIRKYFPSIPRAELFRRLCHLFKDQRLLDLVARILGGDPQHVPTGCGLPIGSLTSQHFANFYLGWFDRFIKEECRIRGYVRNMDDFVIWGKSREELKQQWHRCRDFLRTDLQLELKRKPAIRLSSGGSNFLGCRVFPTHIELNRRSKHRFRCKLQQLAKSFEHEEITECELQQRSTALVAFTRSANVRSWRFRREALKIELVSGQEPRTA